MNKEITNHLSVIAKFAGIVVPALLIIVSVILNTAYRQALFLLGLNQIQSMQSNDSGFVRFIQNIFSLIGNPIIVVLVLVIELFVVKERVRSLIHLIFITGAFYYVAVIKQTFQESRPFWYDDHIQINEWFCPTDFGNPSGHSFIVILAYEPILSDFVGTGPKRVLLAVWLVISALVLISRMYLGAHSLDQIIFGCLLGFAFLIIYKFQFQRMLYQSISSILSQKNKKLYAVLNTIILLLFIALPIAEYLINLDSRVVTDSDIANINSKCNKSVTSHSLKESNLKSTCLGCVAVGLFYGLIMLANKNREDTLYLTGKWKYQSIKSIFLMLAAIVIVAGIPAAILALVIPAISSMAVLNYICVCLGVTWASFTLVYPLCYIQNRYKWISYQSNGGSQ